MKKIIIAGSRDFNDYMLLCKVMDDYLEYERELSYVTIISGTARGADQLGERYAKERGLDLLCMPADWNRHGKSAGYKRNEEMARIATECVVFFDGVSKGTGHMLKLAEKYNLPVKLTLFK